MNKKIIGIFVCILLTSTVVFGLGKTVKTGGGLGDPPKDIDWTSNGNTVSNWWGMDITVGKNVGTVRSVEDSNGDGIVGYCDYIVIEWTTPKLSQPYWKYHCEKSTYVNDPNDPDYGRYKFEFDYNSNSKNPPKIGGCCHYVNDDNTAGPWDGTPEHPFKSIKQTLSSGLIKDFDNIYVAGGTYYETNIGIDGEVNLIGYPDFSNIAQLNSPIINGGGLSTIMTINDMARTVVSGFVFSHCGALEEDAAIAVKSDYNTIFGNTIEYCTNGIYLLDSASYNSIFENIISKTDFGMFIWDNSNNNLMYYNSFYENNDFNAKDKCDNNWNYALPVGGNYWDDYSGVDADGDGIGDTPYSILGEGLNFDNYPVQSKNSLVNGKPLIDLFDGSTSGKPGTNYNYTVKFSDPEYDDGYLTIDWDDGSLVEIIGPIGAGNQVIFKHIWDEKGTYDVRVKATDMYGAESDWKALEVTIPKSKNILNINQGEFTAEIGIGDEEETRVYLDGNYRVRGRFTVIYGTATNGEQEVRFQGLFKGNHFILQIPFRGRIVNIIGRYTTDENREFSGRWTIRGTGINGWIKGTIS